MEKLNQINDHMLGAFVDGELDTAGCELVLETMDNDSAVREQVYRLRRAKDLMKLGFASARAPTPAVQDFEARGWRLPRWAGLAASLLLLVGLGSGYIGYLNGKQLANGSTQTVASAALKHTDRIVLHISESDPHQFAAVLSYTRDFLDRNKARGAEAAVIAHAGGLDLLRSGVSPYEAEVLAMIREYPNVHFIACANSIRNLRKLGIEPVFDESVDTTLPAMDQIIRHVQAGWSYLKVESLSEI